MSVRIRRFLLAGLLGLLLHLCGCSGSGSKMYEVEGNVTWDDKPLPDGDIIFVPDDKQFGPEGGKIKDGKYKVRVREGHHKVEIRATRPVPGKLGPMGEQAIEDYIPEQYNAKTTLEANVSKDKTKFDFPLKSK